MRTRMLAGVALAALALGACADAPADSGRGAEPGGEATGVAVSIPTPGGCASEGSSVELDAGDGRRWCLAREGVAPDVSFTLVVDGKAVARVRHDACSWPNAGRVPSATSVALPDGGTATWGELSSRSSGARVSLSDGRSVQARAVASDVGDGVSHFLVVSPAGTRAVAVAPEGGSAPAPVKVAACEQSTSAAGVAK